MKNSLTSIRNEVEILKKTQVKKMRYLNPVEMERVAQVVLKYRDAGKIEEKGDEIVFHDLTEEDEKVLDTACGDG